MPIIKSAGVLHFGSELRHGSLFLAQKPDRLVAREAYFENRTLFQDWLEANFDLN